MKRWKVEVRKAYFHINLSKAEIRKAFRRTLRWRPWTLLDDAALPTVAVMSKHPNDGWQDGFVQYKEPEKLILPFSKWKG